MGDGVGTVWSRNGKEILYLDDHSRMVSVEVLRTATAWNWVSRKFCFLPSPWPGVRGHAPTAIAS